MKNILVRLTMNNKENSLSGKPSTRGYKTISRMHVYKGQLPRTRFLTSHNSLFMKVYSNRSSKNRTLTVSSTNHPGQISYYKIKSEDQQGRPPNAYYKQYREDCHRHIFFEAEGQSSSYLFGEKNSMYVRPKRIMYTALDTISVIQ